ncbi:MAG: pyridoxal phosphate-dependent aminotransferase [Fidelibacterota bacterium]|nr:MAG: pyridoxal phosphate-dependent aminotransferase [Candidatus Neomarinimicrobiota bacterium]
MLNFADRAARIESSITLEMTARAAELRTAGVDVINLAVGEPDFPTPAHIVAAAKQAMDEGHTRYTPGPGIPALREAITVKLERDNRISATPEQVIVSNGGKHSLFNACLSLFDKGDEVIIFTPYWLSFPDLVKLAHATPIFVGTDPERQFEPRFDELKARITSRTRGIIMNSPSNPTGGVWSREAVELMLELVKEHDLWLLSDECYEALSYDEPFESPASLAPDDEKILTFQSCSKTYAMTGWRIGYMAGPVELVETMSKIQGQSTSCPNAISQMAAIAALTGDQSIVAEYKAAFKRRRGLMVESLSQIPGLSCRNPGGAFYVFLNVSGLFGKRADHQTIRTPKDVTEYLLTAVQVVTVNGEAFGDQEHIRLSYAVSDEDITAAGERITAAVAHLN